MHDLLTDELIGIRTPQGSRFVDLPTLFALLAKGEVDGYTGQRAHQTDPWHVFLVQIAASIQARNPTQSLPDNPEYWRGGLLDLANGQESAWHLIVDDVTKPAFLQHPWKSWDADAQDYRVTQKKGVMSIETKAESPDELDVLVTAKNHDVKISRVNPDEKEAWVYALLMHQTNSGFLGAGNFGTVRMNGGFASRPVVAWTTSLHPSQRFIDEVQQVCALRATMCAAFGYRERGVVLTWLTPWKRDEHQFQLQELEPWFIEAVRPVRLHRTAHGALVALGATSKARQIGPKSLENGDVGDPWIPINLNDKKKGRSALTIAAGGFTPERLTDLLFEQGFELTPLQRPRPGSGSGWFVASVLVRGQGTTDGYHRVELPVPAKVRLALLHKDQRDRLAQFAEKLLSDAADAAKAYRRALTVLAEGGPDEADRDREAIKSWVQQRCRDQAKRWENRYFEFLWRAADEDEKAVRDAWQHSLVVDAHDLLEQAMTRLPVPANRRYRAITRAQNTLDGMLRKQGLLTPKSILITSEVDEEVTA